MMYLMFCSILLLRYAHNTWLTNQLQESSSKDSDIQVSSTSPIPLFIPEETSLEAQTDKNPP